MVREFNLVVLAHEHRRVRPESRPRRDGRSLLPRRRSLRGRIRHRSRWYNRGPRTGTRRHPTRRRLCVPIWPASPPQLGQPPKPAL